MTTSASETETLELDPAVLSEPPAPDRTDHLARCAACAFTVRFQPLASGHGFMLVGSEESLGIGEDGRPTCLNGHGQMEIADDQLPAAEAFALAQEQLNAPAERRLPFPAPRFNEAAVNESIFKQRSVVRLKLSIEESKASAHKNAKKEREEEETILGALIDRFERERKEWLDEIERQEERAASGHPEDTNLVRCKWEEQHPGYPCPICTEGMNGATARDSVGHLDEVIELLEARSAVVVSDALDAIDIIVPDVTIRGWSEEDRAAVLAWAEYDITTATDARPERPKVLGTGHVAGAGVNGEAQCCTQCDAILIEGGLDANYYAAGNLVGVDCPGKAKTDGQHYIGGQRKGGRKKKPAAE